MSSAAPTRLPQQDGFDLEKYRNSQQAKKLVAWVKSEFEKANMARSRKKLQWYVNMAYFYGQQWVQATLKSMPEGYRDKLTIPKQPYYTRRKTVNRIRSFVRQETSKFLSSIPSAIVVPSTAEDQDVRSAYAAEQAWESMSSTKKVRRDYTRAIWWMVLTGNGFVKTWWDQQAIDKVSGQPGDICFGSITPFHLFVPDLREQEIEDQPFVINAYTKTVAWCRRYYGDELAGIDLQPSTTSANTLLNDSYLNLSTAQNPSLDSVVVYEAWVKPGATDLLPQGGVVICVDDHLIAVHPDGLPYDHGQYPYTKFEHIATSTFYADSPLVDLIELQKEYNELRTDIGAAGKRMARPQLLVQKGSLVPSKITNEPGLAIEYRVGYQPPTPIALTPLPQYYIEQQDRVLADMEDLSGQHEVSRGQAPPGVTAGTAISFLQEKDDQYLTPQYQNIEDGWQKLAEQGVNLFIQYVDLPRKIKTIGADGAFDTVLLSGADISSGTDIRIEPGSSIGQSQAAKRAYVMDMFSMGLVDREQALKLLEVGGAQKVLDTVNTAERKAQRENIKMKTLTPEAIEESQQGFIEEMLPQLLGQIQAETGQAVSLEQLAPEELETVTGQLGEMAPPVIPVDDFDLHEVHIDTHNRFRMSQEYEALPEEIKDQFAKHVAEHQRIFQQNQLNLFLSQIPSDGTEDEDQSQIAGPGATMSDNGAVPDTAPEGGF